MTIIVLNDDGSVHHIKTDNAGIYPCFAINRHYDQHSVRGVGVYTTEWKEMDRLHKLCLERDAPLVTMGEMLSWNKQGGKIE